MGFRINWHSKVRNHFGQDGTPYCPHTWHHLHLHRLHSVISDLRPPSVTESGEAALRKLLASRAIGGYSLTL